MSAETQEHGQHALQWAETSSSRVASVRHFGSFATFDVIAPRVAVKASPGQFVMVEIPGGRYLLRRPLSLFRVRGDRVGLLVEARGPGTERLARLEVGETLALAGPLGSAFPVPAGGEALLVGGGIGCAPLQYLADELAAVGAAASAVFGFRDFRAARALGAFELERLYVATEDGSTGRTGTVLDVLGDLGASPGTTVYACGPSAMIAAVQRWAAARGVGGYASLEAHMACGTGSCHGCVVETSRGRLRVCSDGPVFALHEVRQ